MTTGKQAEQASVPGTAHHIMKLGWFLVFAVVYADIGTSIFYVPGILNLSIGNLATLAQIITTTVFVSIALKYVEICDRCPDGGGVVSVCRAAFSKWTFLPLVGGAFITVDYFLTSAISGVSGLYYLASLYPGAKAWVLVASFILLVGLAILNIVGLRESAVVIAWLACAEILVALVLLGASFFNINLTGSWVAFGLSVVRPDTPLTTWALLSGYAATWLAYSGLESASQVSGAMEAPVRKTAMKAMILVIILVAVFSPAITAVTLHLLPADVKSGDPESLLSQLAFRVGGPLLGIPTVLAAAALLFMACNTAMVGNYHVNYSLSDLGFLPAWLRTRHQKFGTPWISIILSAAVPMLILLATRGSVEMLGHLYAFGLLGTLTLSSISIDKLRWRDGRRDFGFWWGAITTLALIAAWIINMVQKPEALFFGGLLTALMVGTGLAMRRRADVVAELSFVAAEGHAADTPEADNLLTVEEAQQASILEPASILVSMRYLNEGLLDEAAATARGRNERNLYLVLVDEVPGLYIALDTRPSESARKILQEACEYLADQGMNAIPIWRLAEDAGHAVADAAIALKVHSVYVGASQRNFLWRLVKGRVLKRLADSLPQSCRLVIVG